MTTQITTSTAASNGVTGSGAARLLDRNQDGTLWAAYGSASNTSSLAYSKDSGATWTVAQSLTGATPLAIFIDLDDYLHIVYKAAGATGPAGAQNSGQVYYVRGTPNAGRTAWSFASLTNVYDGTLVIGYMDIIAFRDPANAGQWVVRMVASAVNGTANYAVQAGLRISSTGTATPIGAEGLSSPLGTTNKLYIIGGSYANSSETLPSVDFRHTGDGKTVASGSPDVFVSWNAGATGAGFGMRFRKAVYAAGAWTWNAEREIDNTHANNQPGLSWQVGYFDGTQFSLAGLLYTSTTYDLVLHDRDAADTTTTTRTLLASVSSTGTSALLNGVASYDSSGNAYLFGRDGSGASGTRLLNYRKWTRSGNTLGAITTISTTGPDSPYFHGKRGYSNSRIETLYTGYAAASPFPVVYASVALNTAPNAPTGLTPSGSTTIDRGLTQRFSWTFSDPDTGDTQSKFDLQYRIGTGAWTTVTQTSTNAYYDFAPSTFSAANYEWQVRTYDSTGTVGPWSASAFFTAASAPGVPTITAPTSGSTIASNSSLVTWSAPSQDAYQVRTVGDNAGAADTSTIYTDTGTVTDSGGRSRTVAFATNGVYQHVQIRVQVGGLWSSWADVRVLVSYTAPATPTLTTSADSTNARITITISDPTPTGSQPTVSSHDVYRRLAGDGTSGTRLVAAVGGTSWIDYTPGSLTAYEYRVVANGSNTTSSTSAWTA